MLIRYAYNSYRISMSYDVYRVKNVQKKIADFEHPTRKGVFMDIQKNKFMNIYGSLMGTDID